MNKKFKVLSSVICGLVLSSGIALTSVQAAPVQSAQSAQINSAAASTVSTSQQYLLKGMISTKGLLYWDKFDGVESYEIRVNRLEGVDGTYSYVRVYKGRYEDCEKDIKAAFETKGKGFYIIKIKGLDINDDVIIQDVLFAEYDGIKVSQRNMFFDDYL